MIGTPLEIASKGQALVCIRIIRKEQEVQDCIYSSCIMFLCGYYVMMFIMLNETFTSANLTIGK